MTNTITQTNTDTDVNSYTNSEDHEQADVETVNTFSALYKDDGTTNKSISSTILDEFREMFGGGPTNEFDEAEKYVENHPGSELQITTDDDGSLVEVKIIPADNATEAEINEAERINGEVADYVMEANNSLVEPLRFSLTLNQDSSLRQQISERDHETSDKI